MTDTGNFVILQYNMKSYNKGVMKTIKLLVLLALTITGAVLNAQKPITVTEESVSFKDTTYPGLSVTIPEVNYESAQKNWIKELQSGTKSKVVTENKEMTISGANIKAITPNPVNVYSKFLNHDSLLVLMVAIELEKNKYVEKANGENELNKTKAFLKQFARDQYVARIEDELKTENKTLKDLESDLESLKNKKLHIQKLIQSNKSDSVQAANNINIQNSEIEGLTKEIMDQNNQMITMQPGKVKDEKTDYIKATEKKKKKAYNEVESLENKISKLHSENEQYNDEIVKNESDQEVIKGKITQQQLVIQKCNEKLTTVKAY
jgi:peptidoglycan hydrolase CwlO-like protein